MSKWVDAKSEREDRFTMGTYFQSLMGLLVNPGSFFEGLPNRGLLRKSSGFLFLSVLFYVAASLTLLRERHLLMTGILFLNAVVMPFITAWIAFLSLILFAGKEVKLVRLFSVFAFASGTTLLVAWIPFMIWLAEPWKWILIYKGMMKGCGLKTIPTLLIITTTISVLYLLFRFLEPVIHGW